MDKLNLEITLRQAVPEDADALTDLAIRSKAAWGYDAAFMAACRDELVVEAAAIARDRVVLAGTAEGQIVGYYHLVAQDGAGLVEGLFVAPDRLRCGIGRQLWRHLEATARALRLTTLTLDADPFAASFYGAMGLTVVGQSPSGSIPGRLLPRMAKDL